MTIQQLSLTDASFLYNESGATPMHIAAVQVFDVPAARRARSGRRSCHAGPRGGQGLSQHAQVAHVVGQNQHQLGGQHLGLCIAQAALAVDQFAVELGQLPAAARDYLSPRQRMVYFFEPVPTGAADMEEALAA